MAETNELVTAANQVVTTILGAESKPIVLVTFLAVTALLTIGFCVYHLCKRIPSGDK